VTATRRRQALNYRLPPQRSAAVTDGIAEAAGMAALQVHMAQASQRTPCAPLRRSLHFSLTYLTQ
jgi:hypothetical protein